MNQPAAGRGQTSYFLARRTNQAYYKVPSRNNSEVFCFFLLLALRSACARRACVRVDRGTEVRKMTSPGLSEGQKTKYRV